MKIDQELDRLVRYNEWANNRMLEAFVQLDESTLASPMGQQVASILGHILQPRSTGAGSSIPAWRQPLTASPIPSKACRQPLRNRMNVCARC